MIVPAAVPAVALTVPSRLSPVPGVPVRATVNVWSNSSTSSSTVATSNAAAVSPSGTVTEPDATLVKSACSAGRRCVESMPVRQFTTTPRPLGASSVTVKLTGSPSVADESATEITGGSSSSTMTPRGPAESVQPAPESDPTGAPTSTMSASPRRR